MSPDHCSIPGDSHRRLPSPPLWRPTAAPPPPHRSFMPTKTIAAEARNAPADSNPPPAPSTTRDGHRCATFGRRAQLVAERPRVDCPTSVELPAQSGALGARAVHHRQSWPHPCLQVPSESCPRRPDDLLGHSDLHRSKSCSAIGDLQIRFPASPLLNLMFQLLSNFLTPDFHHLFC